MSGSVILLNGASSAGKSTLGRALQGALDLPFLFFSPDLLLFGGQVLPPRAAAEGPFSWRAMRPAVFEGYQRCVAALAAAGNNVLADFVLETDEQWRGFVRHLGSLDTFFVGVHCPLPELERRERARGDRGLGDARRDFERVHTFGPYDFAVDSTESPAQNAERVVAAWRARRAPGVLSSALASESP